jgi:hypothetical protein
MPSIKYLNELIQNHNKVQELTLNEIQLGLILSTPQ